MFFMLLYSHTGQGAWRLNTNLVDIRRSGPASFLGPWSSYPWATHPVLGMFHRPLVLLQMYGFEFGLRVVIPVQNWTVSRKSAADTLKILWFLASLVFTFKDLDSLRICSHQVTHIQHHLFWWVGISEKFWCDFESHCWSQGSRVWVQALLSLVTQLLLGLSEAEMFNAEKDFKSLLDMGWLLEGTNSLFSFYKFFISGFRNGLDWDHHTLVDPYSGPTPCFTVHQLHLLPGGQSWACFGLE